MPLCYKKLTLEHILQNNSSEEFEKFAAFMKQTYCTENLAFWRAIDNYRHTYTSNDDKEKSRMACEEIITHYINPNAEQEINIPCDMRQEVLDRIDQGDYRPSIFEPAMLAVTELIRANAFIPWMTEHCPDHLRHLSSTSSSSSSSSSSTVVTSGNSITSSLSFPDKWHLNRLMKSPRSSCSSFRSLEPSIAQNHRHSYSSILKRLSKNLSLTNMIPPARPWSIWRKAA